MRPAHREFLQLAPVTVLGGLFAGRAGVSFALDYPTRPVRVIVPFAPGGPTDVFARLLAQQLSEQLKVQFFIENLAGAGGNIGTGRAAEATPDGYTLLIDGANLVVNPVLYARVPFDPIKDFAPITQLRLARGPTPSLSAPATTGARSGSPARARQSSGRRRIWSANCSG
jgi:tripartite-type tricarboxylate transporter receptor subunit TctC